MDEILYLEPDEEITSVIDKMRDLKSKRVGLVIPRGATLLQSIVNLKLIQKEALALKKELAIITADKIGRNLANQIGITIYDNIKHPHPIHQPTPMEPPKSDDIIELDMFASSNRIPSRIKGIKVNKYERNLSDYKTDNDDNEEKKFQYNKSISASAGPAKKMKSKKIIIAATLIAALVGIFYLLSPKAEINLTLVTEPYEKEIQVTAVTSPKISDLGKDIVKAEVIETEQNVEREFSSQSEKDIGEKSKGEITIFNSWDSSEQKFVARTIFKNNNKDFQSLEEITVPGAKATINEGQLVMNAGTAKVKIEAKEAGEDYNIGPGKFTIPSLPQAKQAKIYAESKSPAIGGSSKKIKIIGEEDIRIAQETILREARDSFINEFREKNKGKFIIEGAVSQEAIDGVSAPTLGSEATNFKFSLKIKNKIITFNEKEYRQKIIENLKKDIPAGKDLVLTEDDEIATSLIDINTDSKEMNLRAMAKVRLIPKIDESELKKIIVGKSENEARDFLKNVEGIKGAEIALSPSWWIKKIPSLQGNLIFNIEYE